MSAPGWPRYKQQKCLHFLYFLFAYIFFSRQFQVADQLADCSDTQVIEALRPMKVVQCVKAISAFVGNKKNLKFLQKIS